MADDLIRLGLINKVRCRIDEKLHLHSLILKALRIRSSISNHLNFAKKPNYREERSVFILQVEIELLNSGSPETNTGRLSFRDPNWCTPLMRSLWTEWDDVKATRIWHIWIITIKNSSCSLFTSIVNFYTFRNRSRLIHDVKWPALQFNSKTVGTCFANHSLMTSSLSLSPSCLSSQNGI